MGKKLEFWLELETEVSCSITPERPARGPSFDHAGGEPAEPSEIEDLYVGVIVGGRAIDITALLTPDQKRRFMEECRERANDKEYA